MSAARKILEVGEIAAMLGDRVLSLVADLLPAGIKEGNEWRVGSVAGERGRSMAVRLSGPRAGVWCDFGGRPEDRGDALDLVAAVLFGGDKRRAIQWSRAWLGLDRVDPAAFAVTRRQVEAKKKAAGADEEKRGRRALAIFLEAQPQIAGTPSERYLKRRAIDFAQLGRQPGCLRHHAGLPDRETGCFWPTLVAAITLPDGRTAAVHRTFLDVQPDGRVRKAPLEDPKQSYGRYAGGCIRLWRGATGKPLGQAERGESVIIGEGIEDVGAAVMAAPEYRALVGVSGANLGGMWLPDAIEEVILLVQNDTKAEAIANWQRAIWHFREELGKRVRIAQPPAEVKDLNELAMREVDHVRR